MDRGVHESFRRQGCRPGRGLRSPEPSRTGILVRPAWLAGGASSPYDFQEHSPPLGIFVRNNSGLLATEESCRSLFWGHQDPRQSCVLSTDGRVDAGKAHSQRRGLWWASQRSGARCRGGGGSGAASGGERCVQAWHGRHRSQCAGDIRRLIRKGSLRRRYSDSELNGEGGRGRLEVAVTAQTCFSGKLGSDSIWMLRGRRLEGVRQEQQGGGQRGAQAAAAVPRAGEAGSGRDEGLSLRLKTQLRAERSKLGLSLRQLGQESASAVLKSLDTIC